VVDNGYEVIITIFNNEKYVFVLYFIVLPLNILLVKFLAIFLSGVGTLNHFQSKVSNYYTEDKNFFW
jgi:hypothetical protein